ncbi:MAG: TIGR00341 family protein [Pseudomonadota bacterium]
MSENATGLTPGGGKTEASQQSGEGTSSRVGIARVKFSLLRWWRQEVVGTVDQAEVIEQRREDCLLTERYLFMTAMSAGIAIIGLLQSSGPVIIGAMLLSPLMGPIIGLGFALAIGDYQWLKQAARSLAWGTVMAVFLCGLLVFLSPIQTITPEIAARTRPNLFDLLVALFSGMAGAYAMIRGRAGAVVGVAIATALMPPLAVVGFGLATGNWTVFSGAMLLYVTNLITIALTAWAMARLYGFRTTLSARQTQFQNLVVVSVFVALAVPLALSLGQIAWEANAQRIARGELQETFDSRARVSELDIDFASAPLVINATVLTPMLSANAEAETERALTNQLGRPVELTLTQFQVGTSASAAEQAELSATRAQEEAVAAARAEDLAKRLALVAGVEIDDVAVDRTRRRAIVRAQRLEGATLAAYKALEERISATEPEWTVELLPPMADLSVIISYVEDEENDEGEEPELTDAGLEGIDLAAWSAMRLDLPIELVGDADDAARAAASLKERGVEAAVRPSFGPLRAQWADLPE